ncbi:MAG: hypothetical protein Q9173_005703 [Seirophora scorigena]
MFGEGATYHSIEGRFRTIKRDAAALLAAAKNDSTCPTPTPSSSFNTTTTTPTTPKKPPTKKAAQGTVMTGRVAKKESPAKKAGKKRGKEMGDHMMAMGAGGIKEEEESVVNGRRGSMDVDDVNRKEEGADVLGGLFSDLLGVEGEGTMEA